MSRELAVFRKASSIIFEVAPREPTPTVSDAQRGNTFLHKGAVCMLTEVSAYQALNAEARNMTATARLCVENLLKEGIYVTNLQTGRTFAVKPDDEIEWIKVTMTVEGK